MIYCKRRWAQIVNLLTVTSIRYSNSMRATQLFPSNTGHEVKVTVFVGNYNEVTAH
jgi:hypothetical protein